MSINYIRKDRVSLAFVGPCDQVILRGELIPNEPPSGPDIPRPESDEPYQDDLEEEYPEEME